MTLLWTWTGRFFGYKEANALWTYDGKHIGWFIDTEVYDMRGTYIGELEGKDRLITRLHKKHLHAGVYAAYANRASIAKYADFAGFAMYAGCEDFPAPENI